MAYLNKVQLIGNVGKIPEIRQAQNGQKVATIPLATTEYWKDKNTGERKEATEWHRIVIFNETLVKVAEQHLKVGSKLYIEGQLKTRKWTDQAGAERYSTEIVIQNYGGILKTLDKQAKSAPSEEDYGAEPPAESAPME